MEFNETAQAVTDSYQSLADCNVGKHQRIEKTPQEEGKGFECAICKARFSFRTNLNRHKRSIHKETTRPRTSCTVPGCTAKFYHQTKLLCHLELAHGKNTEKSELSFPSMEEFLVWKLQEESENYVCFTKQRGALDHLSVTHQQFICQRDGSSRSHSSKSEPGRKTTRKLQKGVVKTDLVCPARMLVRQYKKTGHVKVSYYKSHSHPISPHDTVHHPTPDLVRKDIKNKLQAGIAINQILHELQDQQTGLAHTPSSHVNRLKRINKAQIRAIQRRLKTETDRQIQSPTRTDLNVVVEVLQLANTCHSNASNEENIHIQAAEQQDVSMQHVHIETESANTTQDMLFSEPVPNPLCENRSDYRNRLQALLNEILMLMENENVRKTMLPCVMGNLQDMLSLCHQEANSVNGRQDVEVCTVEKQS